MSTRLVLGGTASGKSAHAERLAAGAGAPVRYVATGAAGDDEMAERIAAHRARRPADWEIVETCDLDAALAGAPPEAAVLIDDLDGWLVAEMRATGLLTDAEVAPLGPDGRARAEEILSRADRWWACARRRPGPVIAVAGQPGAGLVPTGAATRRYVDLHGRLTQRLAADAAEVRHVVAGRAVVLPADAPTALPDAPRGLRDHGDRQVPAGTVDLAVNVLPGPPAWLRDVLTDEVADLAAYPDAGPARAALADRHGRAEQEVVVLAGAAEGFWLLPRALRPRLAACVHPGFTEAEAALRDAGVEVRRVLRRPGADWALAGDEVPDAADLVVLGRPDNPTGVVDAEQRIAALCRPGRTVVVDEAFADFLPDADGMARRGDLPGLVVLRSPTKLWGLAGLRVGYLLAPAPLAARLDAARQPWPVSAPALAALTATAGAEAERAERARTVATRREHLLRALRAVDGVTAWDGAANFVLVRTPLPDLRERLLADGIAVRRGGTFPGLDEHHVRVAVPEPAVADRLAGRIEARLAEVAR